MGPAAPAHLEKLSSLIDPIRPVRTQMFTTRKGAFIGRSDTTYHFAMSDFRLLNAAPLKPRAVLTKSQAVEIFLLKAAIKSSTRVSKMYGVCEKAVRDIWVGRTWAAETWHLDPSRPLTIKYAGRPLGCRDAKPRRSKQDKEQSYRAVVLKELDNGHKTKMQSADGQCTECQQTSYQSLDDILFYWEHNQLGKTADPFQADWKLEQHGQHHGPIGSISEAGLQFSPNSARLENR